jgi:peptidyl-prolyl cis-trans isomerase SurA
MHAIQMRAFCAVAVAGLILCSGVRAQAALANGIKAIVSDTVITYQQVEESAAAALDLLWRQYGNQAEVFEKKRAETRKDALEQLVERQLILHDSKTAGYNWPEPILDEIIQDRIRSAYGDRTNLIKSLRVDGTTYEKFRQQQRERIIVDQLRAKNISQEIMISPRKIEAYYAEHRDEFKMEDQIKLRMIVLDSTAAATPEARKELAQEILAKLKRGVAFSEMASVYSAGSQQSQGGDWGWIERKKLNSGLATIAFALKAGQLSDVISRAGTQEDFWFCEYDGAGKSTRARHFVVAEDPKSKKKMESLVEERSFENAGASANLPPPEEFYLMLVEEQKPSHVRPLSEIRDEIEKSLLIQERDRLQKQWIGRLRTKTFVRYF